MVRPLIEVLYECRLGLSVFFFVETQFEFMVKTPLGVDGNEAPGNFELLTVSWGKTRRNYCLFLLSSPGITGYMDCLRAILTVLRCWLMGAFRTRRRKSPSVLRLNPYVS